MHFIQYIVDQNSEHGCKVSKLTLHGLNPKKPKSFLRWRMDGHGAIQFDDVCHYIL